LRTAGVAAAAAPLAWDVILRHTGGRFFVDAPGVIFPISLEDTGSGVFATALSALLLGFGPLRAASGHLSLLSRWDADTVDSGYGIGFGCPAEGSRAIMQPMLQISTGGRLSKPSKEAVCVQP